MVVGPWISCEVLQMVRNQRSRANYTVPVFVFGMGRRSRMARSSSRVWRVFGAQSPPEPP